MRLGLIGRILALQALVFVIAAVFLPLLIFHLPRPQAVLYLAITFAGVLVLSAVLIGWRIVRPLSRIIDIAEKATGADDALLPEDDVKDEVGRLHRALNKMTRRLCEREEILVRQVAELAAKQRALEDANQALVKSDRLASTGRLAAGVAHEIGNPLQSIQGFLELIRHQGTRDDEAREYLRLVDTEVERIHHLVKDLVEYSRPSAASLCSIDVQRPADAALALAAAQPRFRGVLVRRNYADPPPRAVGEEARILQVVLNLLLNAADALADAGKKSGVVEVRIAPAAGDPAFVDLCVRDDGPGIPAASLQRVFEPFFTTKPQGKGTGLGLAISKGIAESLGGSLRVESKEGEGATFVLRLRAAPPPL